MYVIYPISLLSPLQYCILIIHRITCTLLGAIWSYILNISTEILHLREHVLLSEFIVYPVLHEHMKLPLVFVQFCAQPPLMVRHSLMSSVRVEKVLKTIMQLSE